MSVYITFCMSHPDSVFFMASLLASPTYFSQQTPQDLWSWFLMSIDSLQRNILYEGPTENRLGELGSLYKYYYYYYYYYIPEIPHS